MDDLREFVAAVKGSEAIRVEKSFGNGYVRLMVDEAERRQAQHDIRCSEDIIVEMLRNARDAGAHRIFVATGRQEDERRIVMLDDGLGIPQEMQESVFDARVTSKLDTVHMDRWGIHGRGMALFSIKQNAEVARVVASAPHMGSSFEVQVNARELGERKDQSTWPHVTRDEEGKQAIGKGPHNIIRTCCEFALEEHGVCDVWLGSAAEIIATVRARLLRELDETALLFVDNLEELPVLARLCVPNDARELQEVAASVGLAVSDRTAHRIITGAIRPVRSVYAKLTHKADEATPQEIDILRDRRGLKLDQDDLDDFSRALEKTFEELGEKYYVSLADAPRVRVGADKIVVTFELDKLD
jgi:hypothetical protein